ncbi:MAG: hypothetical protein KDI33_00195 [Halioglobus sp.]|nr:hypothetical protein [Halioglobus sp.]
MAKTDTITKLIAQLTALDINRVHVCQSSKRRTAQEAKDLVLFSDLDKADREALHRAICNSANPTGYYYDGTGVAAGIKALEALLVAEQAQVQTKPAPFNIRNLRNLVADGAIFSVEFVKRSDGRLRKMTCRTGVRRRLRGTGAKYDATARNLLPVFDMEAKDYRSIPVDAIRRLTVGGQTFSFQ